MATISRLFGSIRQLGLTTFLKSNPVSNQNFFRNVTTTRCLFDEMPIKMPALSPTMSSGVIVKWHKKEGEKISAGDILCEVQTDKAVVAYEFDDDGILAKILVQENSSEIQVGDLIAIVCGEDDDWQNVKIPENLKASKPAEPQGQPVSLPDSGASKTADSGGTSAPKIDLNTIKISPSARNMMDQYGIELSSMRPTGPRNALTKEDVLKFVLENKLKPKDLSVQAKHAETTPARPSGPKVLQSASTFVDLEITNMRKTIAKRLTESKSNIPHAYMSVKCFMDGVMELRKDFKQRSLPVSINDMIVKAAAVALKQVPLMNCQWDLSTQTIKIVREIDVSIAVATPTGLITPIIRNANSLTLEEISATSKELINKAKENKLLPQEFVGGTFSISNLGMFDIDHFIAVINPPQAAILAVGSTRQKFFGESDNYRLRNQAIMTLSYDSRVIDEEIAAYFLEKLQENLENPTILQNSDGSMNRRLSALI